ncbi:MAG TPA: nucleotidyltransferase domain-containing protein [Ktedonobacteraceae bacterium]|nr:nucleotidyltransferase domain-containing protein [Ktedonobacteraceae bacterium]
MEMLTLYASTGNPQVDNVLRGTIGILETLFPERIRAYYLHGSFADNTGIETSDIDLFLVPKGSFTTEEREKMQRIMQCSALLSPYMVELMAVDETSLLEQGHFRIKSASRLLWGDDLRASIPEQTLDQYLRMYARFPFIYITHMLRNSPHAVSSLSYPQAAGEFYGYDQHLLPPGNEKKHNIKKLVTGVCWAATVLVAWDAGRTVEGKYSSIQMYKECVHDQWTSFVEEMYERGNRQWHYLVPQEPAARQRLRELCAQTLAFEQYYLSRYKQYLLAELRKDNSHKLATVQHLKNDIALDEECIAALQAVHYDNNEELRRAVEDALQKAQVV